MPAIESGQNEFAIFCIKGHNSEVAEAIWLVIELDRDILPINSFPKFNLERTTSMS
jgi:hypothetical protein